jgi:exopolysaccharide biosynthesis polyprenyl glycosylphosphotransferase
MFSERTRTANGVSLALDAVCLVLAFALGLILRTFHESIPLLSRIPSIRWVPENPVRSEYALFLVSSVAGWIGSLSRAYRHNPLEGPGASLRAVLRGSLWAMCAGGTVVFVLKMSSISRIFFAYYFILAIGLILAKNFALAGLLRRMRRRTANRRRALVIGEGAAATWLGRILGAAGDQGYQLAGILLTREPRAGELYEAPVLGTVDDLDRVLAAHELDEVFLMGTAGDVVKTQAVAEKLIQRGVMVSLACPISGGEHGVRGRITAFGGVPMISFGPMPKDALALAIKRAIDAAAAALALAAAAPLMLALAVLVRLLDGGPALFKQKRLGLGGREFWLYKFRTMRLEAEAALRRDSELYEKYVKNDFKLPEDVDPRILPLGKFLRKSSLDELPQLWNVLKGDMSLVGPRPIVPEEIGQYGTYGKLLLSVRPGLTGRWQVSGRNNIQYPQRAYLELDYASSHSVLSDLSILRDTVPAVVRAKGAGQTS